MTSLFHPAITRLWLALLAAAGVSSCTVYEGGGYYGGGYYGGGYYGGGGYYDEWDADYYDYHPPIYRSYVTYSAAWPYYYGGRYYSYRWWDDHRYHGYRHDHGGNHDRYRKRRSSEELKLVRYRGEDRGRLPSGYHSDQWYKDRGYSLKGNTYRERDGDLRGRRPSSGSSRSDDYRRPPSSGDRRPSSDHPRALRQPDQYRYTGDGRDNRSSRGDLDRRPRSAEPSGRSRGDSRPSSDHPRALLQPDKYRYTGGDRSGGGGSRGGERGGDKGGRDRKN